MFLASLLHLHPPLSRSELGQWIAANMPELYSELGPKTNDQARIRLNEITGLSIGPCDPVRSTLPLYLARLKELAVK